MEKYCKLITPLTIISDAGMQTDYISHLHRQLAPFERKSKTAINSFTLVFIFSFKLCAYTEKPMPQGYFLMTELKPIKIICWAVCKAAIVHLRIFNNPAERLLNIPFFLFLATPVAISLKFSLSLCSHILFLTVKNTKYTKQTKSI